MVIEDKTMFTVEDFVESSSIEILEDFLDTGVRYIKVRDESGDVTFYHVYDDGIVSMVALTDPREFTDASQSFARLSNSGEKVMCNDSGVHREWEDIDFFEP